MLEEGLTALLTADAGLTALVGNRIHPVIGPADNPLYPYLTYQVVSGKPDYALDHSECGYRRIQFDAFDLSYGGTKSVLRALRNALDGFSGTLADGTRVISAVRSIQIDNFEDDARVYRSLEEYEISFSEAV